MGERAYDSYVSLLELYAACICILFPNSWGFGNSSYQQLVITVESTSEFTIADPELQIVFDSSMEMNSMGKQERTVNSSYSMRSISGLQMVTVSLSEETVGIDIFLTMGIPSGILGSQVPSAKNNVLLSMTPQAMITGIMNCVGVGSINYRAVADLPKLSTEGTFVKTLVVNYTLVPSQPSLA